MTSERPTKDGFPIYILLRASGGFRKKKIIGHSQLKFWDDANNLPLKSHPRFNGLVPVILEYKNKVDKINFGDFKIAGASELLFGPTKAHSFGFYEAALKLCGDSTTGSINKVVLKSFNSMFPGISTDDITKDHAKRYMDSLMVVNKPNGVHTYMAKLNALFNKLSTNQNPFKGVRPKKVKTAAKDLDDVDLIKLFTTRTFLQKFDGKNTTDSINHYRYYYMLMFYLGGIDCVDLASLRYDEHVVNGRVQFYRNKGGSDAFVNNKIFPEAQGLLDKFDCYPYLVPIYKYSSQHGFVNNMNKRLTARTLDLGLSKKPLTKSARYSFINRGQQLLIDERITVEIVGHTQQSVHSIYTNEFPLEVRDRAHSQIIDFKNSNLLVV